MATFDHMIVYEQRDEIRTTRWSLDGIVTKDSGNTDKGWLYMSSVKTGNNLVVTLYKDSAGANSVALNSAVDISGLDNTATNAVKITFAAANTSGITGVMFIHDWTEDVTLVPILVSLCMDSDIQLAYARSETAHMYDVYDSTTAGYAIYCAEATAYCLRRAAQLHPNELGGFGGEESHKLTLAERLVPQWSRITSPMQMKDAATFYACWRLFLAADESDGEDSMTAYKATTFMDMHKEAVQSWNLTFDTDNDQDADVSASASTIRQVRV